MKIWASRIFSLNEVIIVCSFISVSQLSKCVFSSTLLALFGGTSDCFFQVSRDEGFTPHDPGWTRLSPFFLNERSTPCFETVWVSTFSLFVIVFVRRPLAAYCSRDAVSIHSASDSGVGCYSTSVFGIPTFQQNRACQIVWRISGLVVLVCKNKYCTALDKSEIDRSLHER